MIAKCRNFYKLRHLAIFENLLTLTDVFRRNNQEIRGMMLIKLAEAMA